MRRWHQVYCIYFILAIISGCAFQPKVSLPPGQLRIKLSIDRHSASKSSLVAHIEVENMNSSPMGFSKTFGITNTPWLSLVIETASGSPVYYPSEVDVFDERPAYICLEPGAILAWDIDLFNWHVTFGGATAPDSSSFALPPGHYRMQARYRDDPNRSSGNCPPIHGTVISDWVHFEVEPEVMD